MVEFMGYKGGHGIMEFNGKIYMVWIEGMMKRREQEEIKKN